MINSSLLKCRENFATGLAAGIETHAHADFDHLPEDAALNSANSQLWGDVPDVLEGNAGERATPAHSSGDTTEKGGDAVAQGLPQVEAFVAVLPHAFHAVGVVGLTKDIFETDLA